MPRGAPYLALVTLSLIILMSVLAGNPATVLGASTQSSSECSICGNWSAGVRSLFVTFRVDSFRKLKVSIEDYGMNAPSAPLPPGIPLRFFKIYAENLSYGHIVIDIPYPEMNLNETDVNGLRVYRLDNSTWLELPVTTNSESKTLTAISDSASLFAVTFENNADRAPAYCYAYCEGASNHDHVYCQTSCHGNVNGSSGCCSEPGNYLCRAMGQISVSFAGESQVALEVIGRNNPVDVQPPGTPVRFFRVQAQNLSFDALSVGAAYTDMELMGLDESSLSLYYYSGSAWVEADTDVNEEENVLVANISSATPSLFVISSLSGNVSMAMCIGGEYIPMSDCLRCHGENGFASSKVYESLFSESIHGNLNNASTNLNRACWTCHANSTEPPAFHPMHNPALTCNDCHTGSSAFGAPLAVEHTAISGDIAAQATCQTCHGKPEMVNYNGSNINSTVSHYGRKRTDMLKPDGSTDCNYCHNGISEFSDVFVKTSRIWVYHDGGVNCSSCHGSGRLHDSVLQSLKGYTFSNCLRCHGENGFASSKVYESLFSESIHGNLNNASTNLNRACWTCHADSEEPDIHPEAFWTKSCKTCHVDASYKPDEGDEPPKVFQHTPYSTEIKTRVSCATCHDNSALPLGKTPESTASHYAEYPEIDSRDCVGCHQNRAPLRKWGSPPDPRKVIPTVSVSKKLVAGEMWRLNRNYSISISDFDVENRTVLLTLLYDGKAVIQKRVSNGGKFTYTISADKKMERIIDLTVSLKLMKGDAVVTLEGRVPGFIHTATDNSECYTCHVRGEGNGTLSSPNSTNVSFTFHSERVVRSIFGPDCVSCHRTGGIAPKQIDVEAFKRSVHANLNNATYYDVSIDPVNRACWACHGNGTQPSGHPAEYLSPRSCLSCHSYDNLYGAPEVYAHSRLSEGLKVDVDCESCHSNSLAKNVTALRSDASHYSLKISLNSTDCLSCHGSQTNATAWGNASLVYSHTKNGACNDCHSAGEVKNLHDGNLTTPEENTCVECHTSETAVKKYGLKDVIRTHYPGAPEGKADTTSVNSTYTCERCHNVRTSLHDSSLVKNVLYASNSTSNSGYSNQTVSCYDCHSVEGKYPYKSQLLIPRLIHGNVTEYLKIGMRYSCSTCHDTERLRAFHDASVIGAVNVSEARCTDCHEPHVVSPSERVTSCQDCHRDYTAYHYTSPAIEGVNKSLVCGACHNDVRKQYHELRNFSSSGGEPVNIFDRIDEARVLTCESCHNATGREKFHYSEFPTGSVQSPGWSDWVNGTRAARCQDCHVKYGDEPPFYAPKLSNPRHSASDCTTCHGGDSPVALHLLQKSDAPPYIKNALLEPQKVYAGEPVKLRVTAVSGWDAGIAAIEFFINEIGEAGSGRSVELADEPVKGLVYTGEATIDTSAFKEGTYILLIHAQDSKGRWSEYYPVPLVVAEKRTFGYFLAHSEIPFMVIGAVLLIYLLRKFYR